MSNNPGLYRQLSEPRTPQDAQAATSAFFDEVKAARERHGIRDVIVLTLGSIIGEQGEFDGGSALHLGNSAMVLPMLAVAYGDERRRHQEVIGRLVAGKRDDA